MIQLLFIREGIKVRCVGAGFDLRYVRSHVSSLLHRAPVKALQTMSEQQSCLRSGDCGTCCILRWLSPLSAAHSETSGSPRWCCFLHWQCRCACLLTGRTILPWACSQLRGPGVHVLSSTCSCFASHLFGDLVIKGQLFCTSWISCKPLGKLGSSDP